MDNQELKNEVIRILWNCDLTACLSMYCNTEGVVGISNLLYLITDRYPEVTKYRLRKTLKELITEELVEFKSVGQPAIEDGYEYKELVCEARPPLNGYKLTKKGAELDICKQLNYKYEEELKKMCEN